MNSDLPSVNELTWQGQRTTHCYMESTPNQANPASLAPFGAEEAAGTSANPPSSRFDHAGTLPRKPSLANPDHARVYFIAGAGLIKIGVTTNVPSRLRAIRNSSPVPVELLGTFRGNIGDEMNAHSTFKHLRRHGEWFEDTAEVRAYLAAKLAVPLRRPDCPTSWWEGVKGCEALVAGFRR